MQKHYRSKSRGRRIFPIILLAITAVVLSGRAAQAQTAESAEETNRKIVRQAFDDWAKGGTRFFDDVLAPDVQWTIVGSSASAGTYLGKEEFLSKAVRPFTARLSAPLVPTVREIFADKDQVIILWDGRATVKDGKPYRNSYAWFFKMKNGKAIEVIAFLDLPAYEDVLQRIKLPAEK